MRASWRTGWKCGSPVRRRQVQSDRDREDEMADIKGGAGAQVARRSRPVAPADKSKSRAKAAGDGQSATVPGGQPVCSVAFCPICTAVTAFGEARPDLLEHLLAASREVLLAFRGLIRSEEHTSELQSRENLVC